MILISAIESTQVVEQIRIKFLVQWKNKSKGQNVSRTHTENGLQVQWT